MKIKCLIVLAMFPLTAIATGQENLGKIVYEKACANCHSADKAKAINAPAAFDKKAWQMRFENAKKHIGPEAPFKNAYDYLVYQVKIGRGLMHHHGLCLESSLPKSYCTNPAYIAAIKYMAK